MTEQHWISARALWLDLEVLYLCVMMDDISSSCYLTAFVPWARGTFKLDAGFPLRFQPAAQLCSFIDSITGSVLGVGWEVFSKGEPSIGRVVVNGWTVGHGGSKCVWEAHVCTHSHACACSSSLVFSMPL